MLTKTLRVVVRKKLLALRKKRLANLLLTSQFAMTTPSAYGGHPSTGGEFSSNPSPANGRGEK
jgi:hypothetical protein